MEARAWGTDAAGSRGILRWPWLAAAAALLAAATWLAWRQEPRPDPFDDPRFPELAWWRYPLERNAPLRIATVSHDLNDVDSPDGLHVWAVGDAGLILHSSDGGRTWRQQLLSRVEQEGPEGKRPDLGMQQQQQQLAPNAAAPDANRPADGYDGGAKEAASPKGESTKGGPSWEPGSEMGLERSGAREEPPATAPVGRDLVRVRCEDALRIQVLSADGWRFETSDGGTSWQQERLDSGYQPKPNVLDPVSAGLRGPATFEVRGIHVDRRDGSRAWAIGSPGVLAETEDRGRTWRLRVRGRLSTDGDLAAFDYFGEFDAEEVFAKWAQRDALPPENTPLNWVGFDVGGWEGAPARSYRRYPAPWYFASWLLVLGLVAPALRRPRRLEKEISVADLLVSDRPIEEGDPDRLDFGGLARGISRFLRNDRTEPPLTLAITGEWGTGKSSLMNLVRDDLRRHGLRPVWFNAWHHQQEEHLLASLLENVRAQAVPSPWTPIGWGFRARLVWRRTRHHWPALALVLVVLSFSLGFVAGDADRSDVARYDLSRLKQEAVALVGRQEPQQPQTPAPADEAAWVQTRVSLTMFLLSWLALLAGAWRGARAFGVRPAQLIAAASEHARVRDASAQVSFRHRFAREFDDVCRALDPRRLVILVDDLDRCRPSNVLQVLEGVNFLVSCGPCFVILGMARERVARCVGLGFKEVAQELVDDEDAAPQREDLERAARRNRIAFAEQYLEKLINVEVPVPRARPAQLQALAAGPTERELEVERARARTARRRALLRGALIAATLAGAVAGGFLTGRWIDAPRTVEAADLPVASAPERSAGAAPGGEDGPASGEPAWFVSGLEAPLSSLWLVPPILLVLAGWGWVLMNRPPVGTKDSPDFLRAVEVWHRLALAGAATPRGIKRFLNRTRYLAMLQRDDEPDTRLERLKATLRSWRVARWPLLSRLLKAPPRRDPSGRVDDADLVALGAMHQFEQDLRVRAGPAGGRAGSGPEDFHVAALLEEHRARFGRTPSEAARERFRALVQGVHT